MAGRVRREGILLAGTHQVGNLKALLRSRPKAIDDRV